jgi:hypothetical protein
MWNSKEKDTMIRESNCVLAKKINENKQNEG